ncbi:MAG TPA: T9SS type A sorting domain-containing protein [Bacteroidales bacterium]|nr:T9SS type A sorting domain-containing protein [Bacteroidales bacterium]HPS17309.1 T9SS type A sorting domain-containing protein [Bacteroidales bacterium]
MKHPYSRKINQFKNTARQINDLIETNSWQTIADKQKQQLQWKLNNLFSIVKNILQKKELKKILAAAAFLIYVGNTNAQTFAPAVNNPFGLSNPGYYVLLPSFTDLDNDGDLDIIALTYYGQIQYFENTGTPTNPAFAAPQTNPFGISYPALGLRPVTVDMDNDGDQDLFTGEYYGAFKYFQNTGTPANPAFALPTTNPFGLDSAFEEGFPAFADFDNDGDPDMLSNEYYGVFKYYENTGTASSPNFAAPTQNPYGLTVPSIDEANPTVGDLDNDGDLDILVGSWDNGGNIYFYRNSGSNTSPSFAAPLLNPFGLSAAAGIAAPTLGDIDNDGDLDLMVGDTTGNFIFYKNNLINGIPEFNSDDISFDVSPNPAQGEAIITIHNNKNNLTIKLFDISGKHILEKNIIDNKTTLNINKLPAGVYIVEVSDKKLASRKKLIVE